MDTLTNSPTPVERISMFWASNDDSWHTPETVCAVLELSNNTLMNWRCMGKGPTYHKSGKLVFYRKKNIVNWLESFQPSNFQAA
jgi:hypothetical protein